MRVYISGPMTGYPNLNFPAFNAAADHLRTDGWEVINPVDINPDPHADWWDCILDDITAMKDCQAIYFLKGWEQSPGANIEYWVAKKHNFMMLYQDHNE